jgi:hypothetical protein
MRYIVAIMLLLVVGCDSYYNSQTENYVCTQDQIANINALTDACLKSSALMSYPRCYSQAVTNFCTVKPH